MKYDIKKPAKIVLAGAISSALFYALTTACVTAKAQLPPQAPAGTPAGANWTQGRAGGGMLMNPGESFMQYRWGRVSDMPYRLNDDAPWRAVQGAAPLVGGAVGGVPGATVGGAIGGVAGATAPPNTPRVPPVTIVPGIAPGGETGGPGGSIRLPPQPGGSITGGAGAMTPGAASPYFGCIPVSGACPSGGGGGGASHIPASQRLSQ